jgi:hypothetical protein
VVWAWLWMEAANATALPIRSSRRDTGIH